MVIAFFGLENWEIKEVKKSLKGKLLFFKDFNRDVKKVKNVDIIGIFIYDHITKEILDKLPKLKFIATMSTGFNHIDLEGCKKRKIKVSNVPFYGENTVAEHTFALILDLSRKISKSTEKTRRGNFDLKGLRGFDLKDKTIGIIGGGHIGMHVARMANGFEMKTLVFDIKKNKRLSKKFKFKYVKLDYLLKNSDVITLHVPLNKYTKHMINTKNLKKIKKGALLINTARGELIETIAIMKGLANKTFKAAGLDVLEGEGRIREEKELLHDKFIKERDLRTHLQNHILLNQENVVITPHNAFNSREALQRILDTTVDNIKAFNRKKNINVVNNKV